MTNSLPFFWCDGWGYGVGFQFWPGAAALTTIAAWRYGFSACSNSPPLARAARRRIVACVSAFAAVCIALLASARHHYGELLSIGDTRIAVANGAFVVARELKAVTPTSGLRSFIAVRNAANDPQRVGPYLLDVTPDFFIDPRGWRVALPLWPALLLTGWLSWRAFSAPALRIDGACRQCGYDLKGVAPGKKCPECGTDSDVAPLSEQLPDKTHPAA